MNLYSFLNRTWRNLNNFFNDFKGYSEVNLANTHNYTQVITDVKFRHEKGTRRVYIKHRPIGSRIEIESSAEYLNEKGRFSNFKPEDSQFIITIATLEEIISADKSEVQQAYIKYVERFATLKHNTE